MQKVKCQFCQKEMTWHEAVEHEDKCREALKLRDGYGNCKNKGIFTMTQGKQKSKWCVSCLARFKKEHIEVDEE